MSLLLAFWLLFQAGAQIDRRAVEWFRKGEELIGTPDQFSDRQAELFERAVHISPAFASARYNLAVIYLQQKKLDQAVEHLDALIELEPEDARGLRMRAQIRFGQGQMEPARMDLDRGLRINPRDPTAWHLLGVIHFQQGRDQDAIDAFDKALDLDPAMAQTHINLAQVHQKLGQVEEAQTHYEVFLKTHPEDFQARFRLGLLHLNAGRKKDALREFLKAETLKPDDPGVLRELGGLYVELGQPEEAKRRLSRSTRTDAWNLANLGVIARREKRYADAERYLRAAAEQSPDNEQLWANLGDVLSFQKKHQEAVEAYGQALALGHENFSTLYNMAAMHVSLGMKDKAEDFLRRAIEVSPREGRAHYSLAVLLDQRKEVDGAQRHFLEALRNGVDRHQGRFRLALFFAVQSQPEEAMVHLTAAIRMEPQTYVPRVRRILTQVRSDLDVIRYRKDFNDLLKEYESVPDPKASPSSRTPGNP